MRLVIQRVSLAKVTINSRINGRIKRGAVALLAVAKGDTEREAGLLARKLLELRCFADSENKMNLSLRDIAGEILVVSQFTLLADCAKGRRPSFDAAAEPETAKKLYDYFVAQLKKSGLKVETGEFGAMMEVELVNDGPVTFIIDSRDA